MSQGYDAQIAFQRMPNRSLVTNDIQGAQSKPRHYYIDRTIKPIQQEQLILNRLNKIEDPNQGRKKYQNDVLNVPKQIIPQGENYFFKGGRRHYEVEDGEIKQSNGLQNEERIQFPQYDDYDRTLYTKDIEGAAPGTLISKVVKNKELAQRHKIQQQMQRIQDKQQPNCKNIQHILKVRC